MRGFSKEHETSFAALAMPKLFNRRRRCCWEIWKVSWEKNKEKAMLNKTCSSEHEQNKH